MTDREGIEKANVHNEMNVNNFESQGQFLIKRRAFDNNKLAEKSLQKCKTFFTWVKIQNDIILDSTFKVCNNHSYQM